MRASIPECELYTSEDNPLSIGISRHLLGIAHHNLIENFQAKLAVPVVTDDLFPGDLLCPMDDPFGVSLTLFCSSSLFQS